MDDDISPFIGQKRADILRGVKEFMDRGKQGRRPRDDLRDDRLRGCCRIAPELPLRVRSALHVRGGGVRRAGPGRDRGASQKAPLADDILPRQ